MKARPPARHPHTNTTLLLLAVRRYDNATTCGLVWTANFVAYRCRTCGISPCMSLCAQCFQVSEGVFTGAREGGREGVNGCE